MKKSERLILSLYDYSEQWVSPYIKAGYPVMCWDKKIEGDILTDESYKELTAYRHFVYGILAAPPCTDFAGSGARWWKEKDKDADRIDESVALVQWVLLLKERFPNLKFWALEQPVGRLERLFPTIKPYRKMLFNPCDYGDPYTKKTVLYGEFNSELKKNCVAPVLGSLIHKIPPSEKRAEIRSTTPAGFAQAFYEANQ